MLLGRRDGKLHNAAVEASSPPVTSSSMAVTLQIGRRQLSRVVDKRESLNGDQLTLSSAPLAAPPWGMWMQNCVTTDATNEEDTMKKGHLGNYENSQLRLFRARVRTLLREERRERALSPPPPSRGRDAAECGPRFSKNRSAAGGMRCDAMDMLPGLDAGGSTWSAMSRAHGSRETK